MRILTLVADVAILFFCGLQIGRTLLTAEIQKALLGLPERFITK